MSQFFAPIQQKINSLVYTLIGVGFVLLMLGVLIVWIEFLARLVIGVLILTIAYTFFYGAYKIITIKRDIEKFFKL